MTAPASASTGPATRVVGVCHRLAPAAFGARLRELGAACGVRLHGVVVANDPAHPPATAAPAELVERRGSNELLDFSGYFEGLAALDAALDAALGAAPPPNASSDTPTDASAGAGNVLFVNDSLLTSHADAEVLGRVLALGPLLAQLRLPAIAGKVDPYRSICRRNPWSGDIGYVTSFCFLLNARALPLLRRLRADAAAAGVLDAAPIDDDAWGRGLAPVFREYVRAHLAYAASPYRWRGAGAIDPGLARKKAACVYFEHRLSGLVGQEGALVPINSGPRATASLYAAESLARLRQRLAG